ncbi:MAG: hypothetical protein GX115_02005 [Ruminiclostridium sp.]|nr:hypothetical protein [Ruminiclostridium sp.]
MELCGSRYYYSLLNENNKKVYEEICKAILMKKTLIPIKGLSLDGRNYGSIMVAVNCDNPQFYYVNFNQCRVYLSLFGSSIDIKYYYTSSKILELNKQIAESVQQILSAEINEHQSDYDKVLRIHDILKFMAVYDHAAITCRNAASGEAHTIVGLFINNKCVCEGYAKAMQLMCTMAGVESILINGNARSDIASGPHAWNMVKINGNYHHVDVTWDSQYAKDQTLSCYGYLNLSDRTIEKDHTWDRNMYPKCDIEPYNYFKMNSALISSKVELERFLCENITNEEEHVSFKIMETNSFKDPGIHAFETIIPNVSARCKNLRVNQYLLACMEKQNAYALHLSYR